MFIGNRGEKGTKEGPWGLKELGIHNFEKVQPPWTAKDAKIKTWLLSQDQVQGTTRKTPAKNELRVRLEYSSVKPQK